MKDQILRQRSNRERLRELFTARPLQWISVRELAQVGGFAAWRTRISELRQDVEKDGGSLVWNEHCAESAYMFKPYVALGRSSETITPQSWTSDGPFTPVFELKP